MSLHVSGKLSGTVESARAAAADFGDRVTVIDTASVSASLASALLGVHALLAAGTDDDAIAAFVEAGIARRRAASSRSTRSRTCSGAAGSGAPRRSRASCCPSIRSSR